MYITVIEMDFWYQKGKKKEKKKITGFFSREGNNKTFK